MVVRRAVAAGPGDGLRTACGIAGGLLAWGALTALGLAALLAAAPAAHRAIALAGAGYLVLLGVRALREHAGGGHTAPAPPTGSPWRTGLLSNLLNPKIAVTYTGLLPALAPDGLPELWGMASLVLLHIVLSFGWLGGCILLLSRARRILERPRTQRLMARITGAVLIAFGAFTAATAF